MVDMVYDLFVRQNEKALGMLKEDPVATGHMEILKLEEQHPLGYTIIDAVIGFFRSASQQRYIKDSLSFLLRPSENIGLIEKTVIEEQGEQQKTHGKGFKSSYQPKIPYNGRMMGGRK